MNLDEIYQQALNLLEQYCPSDSDFEKIVNGEIQEREIENLKKITKYEQFFFVLDLAEKKIKHAHGVGEWLGYEDNTFSLYQYFKIMHPRFIKSMFMLAASSFETANSQRFKIKFMQNKIIAQIALKHSNGKYLLIKRTLYPFQIDKKTGNVIAYLNHFVVLKDYEELDAIEPRIGKNDILKMQDEEAYLNVVKDQLLTTKNPFRLNEKEILILKLIADNPTISQKEISEELKISLSTLRKTDNRRILDKARETFDTEEFKSIKDVALFLRREGVI